MDEATLVGLPLRGRTLLMATVLVLSLAGIVCAATAATPATAAASGDHGPTVPIEAVLAELPPSEQASALVSDLAVRYPVNTAGIRAGLLLQPMKAPATFAQWLTKPIALIADDDLSRRWLQRNGDALGRVNATVLVVRVRSELDMRKLRALRADLPMAPANADHLVRSLTESSAGANAGVYPLVIFPDGRLQQDLLAISATALAPSATAAAPLVSGPSQKEGQP